MKLLKLAGRGLGWLLVVAMVSLLSLQSRLIYFPRPYHQDALQDLERRHGRRIEFTTAQGRQTAFYLPPREDARKAPAFLWLVFGGNGSLSLDYAGPPYVWDGRFGYLFVDYPGYGLCEGSPDPESIRETAVGAVEALRPLLGWDVTQLRERTGVIGHSLGCAAGLVAAEALQLRRAVLCAPFTTMTEMARKLFGWPLCELNLHRFDNMARLRSLERLGARVHLFHGTDDEVIPVAMSRRLSAEFPGMVRLTELPGVRHNDVVMAAAGHAGDVMREFSQAD